MHPPDHPHTYHPSHRIYIVIITRTLYLQYLKQFPQPINTSSYLSLLKLWKKITNHHPLFLSLSLSLLSDVPFVPPTPFAIPLRVFLRSLTNPPPPLPKHRTKPHTVDCAFSPPHPLRSTNLPAEMVPRSQPRHVIKLRIQRQQLLVLVHHSPSINLPLPVIITCCIMRCPPDTSCNTHSPSPTTTRAAEQIRRPDDSNRKPMQPQRTASPAMELRTIDDPVEVVVEWHPRIFDQPALQLDPHNALAVDQSEEEEVGAAIAWQIAITRLPNSH